MKKYFNCLIIVFAFFTIASCQQETKKESEVKTSKKAENTISKKLNPDAKVFFEKLKDGDIVSSPFKVYMGVKGMVVDPAGQIKEGSGHHHILINETFMKEGSVIPMDKTHLHFGKGQTITELNLEPGKYSLTLQFANGAHMSYGEGLSKTINIEVK